MSAKKIVKALFNNCNHFHTTKLADLANEIKIYLVGLEKECGFISLNCNTRCVSYLQTHIYGFSLESVGRCFFKKFNPLNARPC